MVRIPTVVYYSDINLVQEQIITERKVTIITNLSMIYYVHDITLYPKQRHPRLDERTNRFNHFKTSII